MSERIVKLSITGRVQGVGYRYFVQTEAEARNLRGWVRNRRDGTVEAIVAGPADAVEDLIAACWRGPSASRVADIHAAAIEAVNADLPPSGFVMRPTA